jgi:hypothetical protein
MGRSQYNRFLADAGAEKGPLNRIVGKAEALVAKLAAVNSSLAGAAGGCVALGAFSAR